VAVGWLLWCLALTAGLWLGCALPAWLRLGLAALVLSAGWLGARQLRRGAGALRLAWEPDGRWRVYGSSSALTYVQPDTFRRLGPMLWISWRGSRGARYLRADGIPVEPMALRTLKARMRLAAPAQVTMARQKDTAARLPANDRKRGKTAAGPGP
jgi:hypothetical protein